MKLNGGSSISYSQGYGVDSRIVNIEGEGYFEVKKDSTKPFIVNSANIIVKVLGTKFNFCDYPKETQALVALDEGKVNMTCIESKQEITLLPNQHVVFVKKFLFLLVGLLLGSAYSNPPLPSHLEIPYIPPPDHLS